jgi:chaperonin cofactor prefoldin
MVKSTWRELKPDDPIFKNGPQVFVPMSKPKAADTEKQSPEQTEEQANASSLKRGPPQDKPSK